MGDRWRPGMTIQFWEGNPRYPKFKPEPFTIPQEMASHWDKHKGEPSPLCSAIENWIMVFETIIPLQEQHEFLHFCDEKWKQPKSVPICMLSAIAHNDGLTLKQFKAWFYKSLMDLEIESMKLQGKWRRGKSFHEQPQRPSVISGKGQLIHWTDNIYFNDLATTYQAKTQV